MAAIVKVAGQAASNIGYLRERTLASWIAANKVNETLLAQDWPELGIEHGTLEMAGREWRWELTIGETPDPDMRRVEITVRGDRDAIEPLAEVAAFKGRL